MSQSVESGYVLTKTEEVIGIGSSISSLAELWAKKYVKTLEVPSQESLDSPQQSLTEVASAQGRLATAEQLRQSLRFTSAQAWSKTETLLAKEVQRHQINPALIDPWQVAEDSLYLFEQALKVYTQQSETRTISVSSDMMEHSPYATQARIYEGTTELPSPGRLSVTIGPEVGRIRRKYTAQDPRVLGFVSMQFHYTGQFLLDVLSPLEKALVSSYFKVIDDNLYMPLQRAYEAAGSYDFHAPQLAAIQKLLPISTDIAKSIAKRVAEMNTGYRCYSGPMNAPGVRVSTIRDIEMFQVYLCLCVLEGSIASLQSELFPLCVMLYPPLKVRWDMIRNMLRLLGQEIGDRLGESHTAQFRPYIRVLWDMFSEQVLSD